MDHSKMDHSKMQHSGMDMPDMPDMPDHGGMKMCNMKMTLNADYENLCVLTDKWMIETKLQLVLSLFVIIMFTALYELTKRWSNSLEYRYANLKSGITSSSVTEGQLKKLKYRVGLVYAFTVLYSFMIMLLFMSFNWWIMGAVTIGAGIGKLLFGIDGATFIKSDSLACH